MQRPPAATRDTLDVRRETGPATQPGPRTRFQVLGLVSITDGHDVAVLAPSKPTILLAALLLQPNDVVTSGSLSRAIWGEDQPLTAKAALQTCVLRLRQLFTRRGIMDSPIETVPGGYRIGANADSLDLVDFRQLLRRADQADDPESELALLEDALALWRGPLLANVPSDALHRDVIPRIAEERLRVVERISNLKIAMGRARSALGNLWEVTRAHPAHERFSAQLAEALYRTGRQAEALAELRRIKDHLHHELGVDPGRALQELELTILRGEELAPSISPPVTRRRDPGTVSCFTGRAEVTAAIAGQLRPARADTTTILITGAPGIGKTALALHVAGLVRDDFPDGWTFIDMKRTPRPPAPAPGQLVILDDVANADEVAPVLAAHGGGAVIITSRQSLAGLVARHGGRVHRLDVLDPEDSYQLLAAVLGADRVGAELAETAELAAACGHFPLALRVIGARLLGRPRMRVADAVAWLRADPIGRLTLPDDPQMSVAHRFDEALAQLSPALAAAFRRLGAADRTQFSSADGAAILHVTREAAEQLFDQLVDANLLEEGSGHYSMHELLRLFARGSPPAPPLSPLPSPLPIPIPPTLPPTATEV